MTSVQKKQAVFHLSCESNIILEEGGLLKNI